jgi:hypothetical protein
MTNDRISEQSITGQVPIDKRRSFSFAIRNQQVGACRRTLNPQRGARSGRPISTDDFKQTGVCFVSCRTFMEGRDVKVMWVITIWHKENNFNYLKRYVVLFSVLTVARWPRTIVFVWLCASLLCFSSVLSFDVGSLLVFRWFSILWMFWMF